MKKIILVLLTLLLLVGVVFAEINTKTLRINVTINPVAPSFQLLGKLSGDSEFEEADHTFTTEPNAILSGITLNCKIAQSIVSKYIGSVALIINVSDLSNTAAVNGSAAGSIIVSPNTFTISPLNDIVSQRTDIHNTDVRKTTVSGMTVTPSYNGESAAIADIAEFNVTWPATDLPPATYTATITMIFESP